MVETIDQSRRRGRAEGTAPGRVAGEFLRGVALLGRGWVLCVRTPRLLAMGLVPVVVTAVVFAIGFAVLLVFLGDLAAGVTWFADSWSDPARTVARLLAGVAIVGAAFLVAVVTFTAVVLAIGEPFYERISQWVEQLCGGGPEGAEPGFWRSLRWGLADSVRLLAISVGVGAGLFLGGLVPAVGQTVVPVLGAAVGGWLLAVELVGIPFTRRGRRLRDRWRALRPYRARTLGFGMAVFGCFLVPGGAVLMMPAAVAGGTLLARRVLDLPDDPGVVPGGVS